MFAIATLLEKPLPRSLQQRRPRLHAQPGLRELHHPAFGLPSLDSLDDHARCLDGVHLDIHQFHDDFAAVTLQPCR